MNADFLLEEKAADLVNRLHPLRAALRELETTLIRRQAAYGYPLTFIARYRDQLEATFGLSFPGVQAVLPLVLLKLTRLQHNPHHEDSWLDLAGYALIALTLLRQEKGEEAGDGDGS